MTHFVCVASPGLCFYLTRGVCVPDVSIGYADIVRSGTIVRNNMSVTSV